MANHIVYLTTNMITGEMYIGKHSDPKDWYLGSGTRLKRAISKYGKEAFKRETLSTHETAEAAFIAEDLEIKRRDAINSPSYYNIAKGGRGGGYERKLGPREAKHIRSGWKHTEVAKQSISKNHSPNSAWQKGKERSIINRTRISEARKGIKFSESHCLNIAIAASGENGSQYGTIWITDGNVNKKIKNIDIIPEGWYKGRTAKQEWYLERGKRVRS